MRLFSERTRRIVYHAQEWSDEFVGPLELLVGLLYTWQSTAADILEALGADVPLLREQVSAGLTVPVSQRRTWRDQQFSKEGLAVADCAYGLARELPTLGGYVGTEHLLYALLQAPILAPVWAGPGANGRITAEGVREFIAAMGPEETAPEELVLR